MADTVEIASVLPKELRLGVPPKMPQGRSYLFRQQSTLQSYTPTRTITINIPRLQRSYLRKDSYLRFRVNGSWTPQNGKDVLTLDTCGAYGFFDRIEVFDYLGSTVLESISGIPQLSSLLLDMGLKEFIDSTNGSVIAGLGYDYTVNGTAGLVPATTVGGSATKATAQILTATGTVFPASTGAPIASAGGVTTATPFSREFAIPLPSFLGLLSDKYVPLHNGFTIVLTLSTKATPFFVSQQGNMEQSISISSTNTVTGASAAGGLTTTDTTTLSWTLEDVYMNCQILELGPVADAMMMTSTQGQPMVVHTKAMRNYVGTVKGATYGTVPGPVTATGQQEFVLNMNLNVASLTNVLFIMRSTAQLDNTLYLSAGNRTRNFLQRWQFQYGSTALPQSNGIQTMASYISTSVTPTPNINQAYDIYGNGSMEGYQELMKARPFYLPASRIIEPCYNWDSRFNYNLDQRTATSTSIAALNLNGILPSMNSYYNIGRFAGGLNLQLANNKDGQMITGLNTNGMNTSVRCIFHPLYTDVMDTVRVDAWAEYDAFVNISPGIATTVSF